MEVQVWLNERIYHFYSRQHTPDTKERMVIGAKSFRGYVAVDPDEVKQIFNNGEDGVARCPILPEALRVTRLERDRFELEYSVVPYVTDTPGAKSFSGRPSTMHRISAHMRERFARGELRPTLNDEARVLYEWAKSSITDVQIPTVKTIIEGQRGVYRELSAQREASHI